MAKRAAAGTLALAVCLSGGAVALAGAANATSGFAFNDALAGKDRAETAAMISAKAFPKAGDAKAIVLANGWSSVDGLSASYVAGVKSAPVLFTDAGSVPMSTQTEMARLGVKDVYIVGGTTVVSASVVTWLTANGYTVKDRFGGADRYETSADAAEAGDTAPTKVFLASGDKGHNADALVVSPIAYKQHYPVLLTSGTSASSATKAELAVLGTKTVITVGGNAVISDSIATAFGSDPNARLAGASRQETATKVADWAIKGEGFSKTTIGLVSGANGHEADALASASLAAHEASPLLYTDFDGSSSATTEAWLKLHASDLTTGWAFGGTDVVSSAAISAATKAAASVTISQGYTVVTFDNTANTFTYADPASKAGVTVTYKTSDKFAVDGSSASLAVFKGALGSGDLISWSKDSSGVTTYSLTIQTVSAGLVSNINTTAKTFDVVDPITGLAVVVGVSYNPTQGVWMVDGKATSQANFLSSLSVGDQIAISGGTSATPVVTLSLANGAVSGTVTAPTGSGNTLATGFFGIKTAAGATFGDFSTAGGTVTLNGAASTVTTVNGHLSVGDVVSYAQVAGVTTISVTDTAASAVTGTFSSATGHVYTYYTGSTAGQVDASTGTWIYKVDGTTVTQTEFETAARAGAQLTFTRPDGQINTTGSLALTSGPLSGTIGTVNTSTHVIAVMAGTSTTNVLGSVTYTSPFFPNTSSQAYFINGTAVSGTAFQAEAARLSAGNDVGSLTANANGTVSEYHLTVAVAPAAITSVSNPGAAAGTTTLTVTFNNPVYMSGTAAASDFVILNNGTPVTYLSASPTTLATASNSVTLTVASTTFAAGTNYLSVQLTDSGAAKFTDGNGKTAATGEAAVTRTVS